MVLKWSVPDLMKNRDEFLEIDETISIDDLKERDPEVRDISPVRVTGLASIKREAVTFHLTIDGKMTLPCSVTLEDVLYPFRMQMSETFRINDHLSEDDAEGEQVHDVEGEIIDLTPYIIEEILVQKPIRVVSDKVKETPHLKGNGWELLTDEGPSDRIDPRLEKLKHFFDE
ncbi:uncharacterized protein JOD43_000277 [Pullulanibacillus pueri]|uniref:DUF177 domain-containing protein n=1 Tax=Pullulanibacillus pueri TaxID=1437324 RepID=A0A8J3EJC8_9BACL|nr:YceD family protein [Pullulanibacillus pueri]MBM7680118.1 uncharacterized protein [Pullulanibacillus pueri]GGH74448.1 hypothetical protein GCM10007096_02690 [Pullulanibacillus pueri]